MSTAVLQYTWRHPVRTLVWLGLLSLICHALTIYWLRGPASNRAHLGKPAGISPTVKIKITQRVKVAPVASTSRSAPAARTGARHQPSAAAPKAGAVAAAGPQTYSDLLPSGAWQAEQMGKDITPTAGTNVGVAPAARAAIDELSSRLDIPLLARAKGGKSRAVAKVILGADQIFILGYLDGDPLLRACLYAALTKPANLAVLKRMMEAEGKSEFVVAFAHEASSAINLSRYVDNFLLADGKLSISRTTFQPLPTAGIALPDADQKRAEARDRMHLQRLRDSPAYQSPLRQRSLGKAT